MMKQALKFVLMVMIFCIPTTYADLSGLIDSPLPVIELKIGDKILKAEVASTPQTMSKGLMFRDSLPSDQGMIFIFPKEIQVSFWMKNTQIPLSIAYIDGKGVIREIHNLIPYDETAIKSKASSIRFALEVNRDWFSSHHIHVGDRIEGLEDYSSSPEPSK